MRVSKRTRTGVFGALTFLHCNRRRNINRASPSDKVQYCAGTLGTGDLAFPSAVRSIESTPSELVDMAQTMSPLEKNGFTIIDVTPEKMTFSLYTWRDPQPLTEIDSMTPTLIYEVPRKA